jgi:hypothetical protein
VAEYKRETAAEEQAISELLTEAGASGGETKVKAATAAEVSAAAAGWEGGSETYVRCTLLTDVSSLIIVLI